MATHRQAMPPMSPKSARDATHGSSSNTWYSCIASVTLVSVESSWPPSAPAPDPDPDELSCIVAVMMEMESDRSRPAPLPCPVSSAWWVRRTAVRNTDRNVSVSTAA